MLVAIFQPGQTIDGRTWPLRIAHRKQSSNSNLFPVAEDGIPNLTQTAILASVVWSAAASFLVPIIFSKKLLASRSKFFHNSDKKKFLRHRSTSSGSHGGNCTRHTMARSRSRFSDLRYASQAFEDRSECVHATDATQMPR